MEQARRHHRDELNTYVWCYVVGSNRVRWIGKSEQWHENSHLNHTTEGVTIFKNQCLIQEKARDMLRNAQTSRNFVQAFQCTTNRNKILPSPLTWINKSQEYGLWISKWDTSTCCSWRLENQSYLQGWYLKGKT